MGFTSDNCLYAGGYQNISGADLKNVTDFYSDSAGTWTSKAIRSFYFGNDYPMNLTTDIGVAIESYSSGAPVQGTNQYTVSSNTWSMRLLQPMTDIGGTGAASLNSDSVMTTGGQGTVIYVEHNFRFAHSSNSWATRGSMGTPRGYNPTMSMGGMTAHTFTGYNHLTGYLTSVERYNDGETYFKGFAIK
jgi:hypothetical protein